MLDSITVPGQINDEVARILTAAAADRMAYRTAVRRGKETQQKGREDSLSVFISVLFKQQRPALTFMAPSYDPLCAPPKRGRRRSLVIVGGGERYPIWSAGREVTSVVHTERDRVAAVGLDEQSSTCCGVMVAELRLGG